MAKAHRPALSLPMQVGDQLHHAMNTPLAPTQRAEGVSRPSITADDQAILVDLMLAPPPPSEFVVHLDTKLTSSQSTIARRLAAHLDRQQACLKNGQRVLTPSAAIKWLLERIAEASAV